MARLKQALAFDLESDNYAQLALIPKTNPQSHRFFDKVKELWEDLKD